MKEYIVRVFDHHTEWLNKEGLLHREDGPALECLNGSKEWYLNGQPHREDGPAVECVNGGKEWYRNGLRHREDGAAVEYHTGVKAWYLNNIRYTEADFNLKMNPTSTSTSTSTCAGKVVEIDGKKYKLVEI